MTEQQPELSLTPVGPNPKERFISYVRNLFDVFDNQMQALRDIIQATIPHASALDNIDPKSTSLGNALGAVPDAHKENVAEIFRQAADQEHNMLVVMRKLFETYKEDWSYRIISAMHEMMVREPRLPMLRNSLLMSGVATFEAVIANLVTEFYNYKPEALEMNSRDREKEFSLRDLQQFSSISDAVDFTVAKRVESLMYGGLADWRKFFKDTVKVDIADLAISWPDLQEVFQRRHIIVHNGGKASRRYVAIVTRLFSDRTVLPGEPLDCTEEYLALAVDHLLAVGTLLIVAIMVKFGDPDDIPHGDLSNLAYSLLREERWAATKRLCEYGVTLPVSEDVKLVFRVNMALAEMGINGRDAIVDDITSWDVSALSDRFKLAKACLLGDLDKAFELLPSLVITQEITTEDLLGWPLLSEMRSDPRFSELMPAELGEQGMDPPVGEEAHVE